MRCGCPHCEAFMIQSESKSTCTCPDCEYTCTACLGTNSLLSKEDIDKIRQGTLPFPFTSKS